MMRAADEVIVVVDSTKFGRQSLATSVRWRPSGTWWSTAGIEPRWREKIVAAGVTSWSPTPAASDGSNGEVNR